MKPVTVAGTSLEALMFWKHGQNRDDALAFLVASLTPALRGGAGAFAAAPRRTKPAETLDFFDLEVPKRTLYSQERCPFARLVREALSFLEVDVVVHPCPDWATENREALRQAAGGFVVPYFIDYDRGFKNGDSQAILHHLFVTYGGGTGPWQFQLPFSKLSSIIASRLGGQLELQACASHRPKELLELWGYEASPYTRRVREGLEELALPYVSRAVPRGAARRKDFERVAGKQQFPFLVDRNTGHSLFESAEILRYLRKTYAGEEATKSGSEASAPAAVSIPHPRTPS